jgi:hypothetical protein
MLQRKMLVMIEDGLLKVEMPTMDMNIFQELHHLMSSQSMLIQEGMFPEILSLTLSPTMVYQIQQHGKPQQEKEVGGEEDGLTMAIILDLILDLYLDPTLVRQFHLHLHLHHLDLGMAQLFTNKLYYFPIKNHLI